ncbi:MAG: DUF1360 domain-containing protein [Candidatus Thorarchaeota archaeon]|jgi:hypothetical protein
MQCCAFLDKTMTLIVLLSLSAATWRMSSLLVNEDGPRDMLAKFRYFIGVRYDELNFPIGTNVVSRAFTCVWCLSVWVAIAFTILWLINESLAFIISLPLALSAAAIIVENTVNDE